ncbi:MAG TPA: Trm112 family protein [Terracidiphilus sp.]|nr:Trm112 family protein [Terracidiphilus sp.]
MEFDPTVADMLACPACHADLRAKDERLVCGGCGRRYPVEDGIPVLIADRAEQG